MIVIIGTSQEKLEDLEGKPSTGENSKNSRKIIKQESRHIPGRRATESPRTFHNESPEVFST